MLRALRAAVSLGWRDLALLDSDPAFAFARDDTTLRRLEEEALRRPPFPSLAAELGAVASLAAPPRSSPTRIDGAFG